MPTISVQKSGRGLAGLDKALAQIQKSEVLVGIPEDHNTRSGVKAGNLNNAELLFILTNGVNKQDTVLGIRHILSARQHIDYFAYRASGPQAGFKLAPLGGKEYAQARELYIRSFGSPAMRIPPRPVIEPAINYAPNRKIITRELGEAAGAYFDGKPEVAERFLKRAGLAGQNASRAWFTSPQNSWPPNAPSTIKRKGSSRPNVDTGALRRSIVYVVRVGAS